MQQTRRNVLKAIGLGGVSVFSGVTAAQTTTDGADMARVRGIYAIPGGPPVDVFVDGTRIIDDLSYKQVSRYFDFASGQHTIRVVPVGQPQVSSVQREATLESRTDYTVAATGRLQSPDSEVYVDDNTVPASDEVRLRVIHLSPDAPAVDVEADGTQLVSDLGFGNASDYLTVPARSSTLRVTPVGETDSVGTFPVSLTGGTVVTAFAVGLVTTIDSSQAFDLVTAVDARR
ncbi:cell wall protein [Haladaptatus sp. W1]|uniref:DUF4397 domain-containing protein n=1 Tax=Haladaptatus sp. W1 TaxID=1897478 RepID=UPI000849E021|nr:DUF4397 domain-containing protein [Haladaptatus sp. W1]ODR79188.1 cell wall protein [Haladaptatus sp. W1]